MTAPREVTGLVAMDLTDAVMCVVIRRDPHNSRAVLAEHGKHPDITTAQAAGILRRLADNWEAEGQ